jgi:two-component system OmpR family response regulator
MAATVARIRSASVARPDPGRTTVLVVEAEPELAAAIAAALEARGDAVWHARSGGEAKELVRRVRPRLIVLDLVLPDVDGLVLMGDLAALGPAAVVMLGPGQHPRDVVLGLRLGAEDVIAKPFDMDEFVERVQVVLRRRERAERAGAPAQPEAYARIEGIQLDRARGRATVGGRPLALTPIEFRLLAALVGHPEHYVPREDMIEAGWGHRQAGGSRALDVHVARLRSKLRAVGGATASIVAVRLPGYRLVLDSQDGAGRPLSAAADPGTPARPWSAPETDQTLSAACMSRDALAEPGPPTNR